MPTKPVIGLTGGIGSGKSTVARLFARLGCGVIDADALAREALQDSHVVRQLVSWWGDGILDEQGRVDRRKIADIVFDKPDELARLEAVVHPAVHHRRHEIRRQMQDDPAIVAIVEDCPLLLEKQLDRQCDVVVFVKADDEVRRRRVLASRGWSPEELARREKNQMGLDIKANRADHVLQNNGGEAECFAHVRQVLSQILRQSA
jgi:dephospho-CoA kinase